MRVSCVADAVTLPQTCQSAVPAQKEGVTQEGVGSITLERHVSNRLKFYKFGFLASRAIDWYVYESNPGGRGVGWSPDVVIVFLGGGSSFFLGHSHGVLNISLESSAQAQSIGTLFE